MRHRLDTAKLFARRMELGLTHEGFAALIGESAVPPCRISGPTAWRWETGRSIPNAKFIPALLKVLKLKQPADLYKVKR